MRALIVLLVLALPGCVVASAGNGGDTRMGRAGDGGDATISSVSNTTAPKTDVTVPIKPY